VSRSRPKILLVTGMSGAGKSTVLRTLEDLGWETVDNLPFLLLNRLLDTPPGEGSDGDDERPLALGIGTQTRGFDAESIVQRIKKLREDHGHDVGTLFLECAGSSWSGAIRRRAGGTRWRRTARPATASPASASCSCRCAAGRTG
jgi:UPF0042 nucleotide-binding protein